MKTGQLDRMTRGWFVGDFEPSIYKTQNCEVAVKRYKAGEQEARHFHKVATEVTVVITGSVRMNGAVYNEGEMIVIDPGEATDFMAIEDSINVVVKIPGVKDDKYVVEE